MKYDSWGMALFWSELSVRRVGSFAAPSEFFHEVASSAENFLHFFILTSRGGVASALRVANDDDYDDNNNDRHRHQSHLLLVTARYHFNSFLVV